VSVLDLSNAARLYWGSTEAQALYRGSTLLWEKPEALPDIAFPSAIFDTFGVAWDPYGPGILQSSGGSAAGLGDPVGYLPGIGNTTAYDASTVNAAMTQATSGNRPTLAEIGGRRALLFDGVGDRLESAWLERFEPTIGWTAFAMIHLGETTDNTPLCFTRVANSNSFFEPFRIDGSIDTLDPGMRHSSTAFLDGDAYGAGFGGSGWKTMLFEYTLSAFATDGGTVKLEINGSVAIEDTITPTKPATSNITTFTGAVIGARRTGGTVQGFFSGHVGRCGSISRLLTSGEKATLRRWLEGTSYVAP
jgi:hypothetical protein